MKKGGKEKKVKQETFFLDLTSEKRKKHKKKSEKIVFVEKFQIKKKSNVTNVFSEGPDFSFL